MKRKQLIIGGVVLIAIVGTAGVLMQPKEKPTYGSQGPIVEVKEVAQTDLEDYLEVTGKMVALDKAMLYVEVEDKVVTVKKRVGDLVEKGEILMTLEGEQEASIKRQLENNKLEIENAYLKLSNIVDADNKAEVLNSKAVLAELQKNYRDLKEDARSAQEQVNLAQIELSTLQEEAKLIEELYKEGLASEEQQTKVEKDVLAKEESILVLKEQIKSYQSALQVNGDKQENTSYSLELLTDSQKDEDVKRTAKVAQNDIKVLENKQKDLEESLDKVHKELVAPITGVVAEVNAEEGEKVLANTAVMTLVGEQNMLVKVDVSPEDSSYIEEGQACKIEYLGRQEVTGEGIVSRISPSVVEEHKSNGSIKKKVPIEIEINNISAPLKDGLEVDIAILIEDEQDVVVLPKRAISEDEAGNFYVYAVESNCTVKSKPVTLGSYVDDEVVVWGIEPGERIVVSGGKEIANGQQIRFY